MFNSKTILNTQLFKFNSKKAINVTFKYCEFKFHINYMYKIDKLL